MHLHGLLHLHHGSVHQAACIYLVGTKHVYPGIQWHAKAEWPHIWHSGSQCHDTHLQCWDVHELFVVDHAMVQVHPKYRVSGPKTPSLR